MQPYFDLSLKVGPGAHNRLETMANIEILQNPPCCLNLRSGHMTQIHGFLLELWHVQNGIGTTNMTDVSKEINCATRSMLFWSNPLIEAFPGDQLLKRMCWGSTASTRCRHYLRQRRQSEGRTGQVSNHQPGSSIYNVISYIVCCLSILSIHVPHQTIEKHPKFKSKTCNSAENRKRVLR